MTDKNADLVDDQEQTGLHVPETIRLTAVAQDALSEIADYLDGETSPQGLSVTVTASRLVEAAILDLRETVNHHADDVMEGLVRAALSR